MFQALLYLMPVFLFTYLFLRKFSSSIVLFFFNLISSFCNFWKFYIYSWLDKTTEIIFQSLAPVSHIAHRLADPVETDEKKNTTKTEDCILCGRVHQPFSMKTFTILQPSFIVDYWKLPTIIVQMENEIWNL